MSTTPEPVQSATEDTETSAPVETPPQAAEEQSNPPADQQPASETGAPSEPAEAGSPEDSAPAEAVDTPGEQPVEDRGPEDAVEEPQGEEPQAEEPQAEEPQGEEPQAEEPQAEEPQAEEAQAEEPQGDLSEGDAAVEPPADATVEAGAADDAEGQAEGEQADGEQTEGEQGAGKRRKKKGKGGEAKAEPAKAAEPPAKKRKGPEPSEVVARIGTTNDRALAYLAEPDPKLSRLSRKVVEALLPDLPPVTAGALLGPAGFTRHLVASAAAGRYRDLFVLWETFRRFPAEAKPELAERGPALARAQEKLKIAVRIGLTGRAERLAEDIAKAEGLIWQWLREALVSLLPAVGARPAIASALLAREPGLDIPMPAHPDERWLAEAAAARRHAALAAPVEAVLRDNVHRLPATVDTLRLATLHYPERVEALVDRVDLDAPDIGAFLAWARDHGAADRLHGRIRERVGGAAARDRVEGLARWYAWQQRGVQLELPDALRVDSLEGFDLSRPETAELAARLVARGIELDLQGQLDALAAQNRQLAEKAYEAMVCANLDVTLPAALEDNPVVNPGTRCPKCRAWTWVRPGHEARCPRPEAPTPQPVLDPFELAAAEAGVSDVQG